MKKFSIIYLSIVVSLLATTAQGQTYKILHETDTTMKAKLSGITLGSRDVKHIVYEFPSKDTDGNAVTISGIVTVPSGIADGSTPCDGIILFHHPTIGSPSDAPSQGGLDVPSAILANPLRPNYIVVMSDNIGYGSSIDHQIAYLCGDVNARNSLDGLLAARQMLTDKQIPLGKYLFNVGYSQGGSDAMYAAKLRDMEYKDKGITFTKTFVGGGVMDCEKAYAEFAKGGRWDSMKDVAIMLISLNENYHLGIDYNDLFQEPVASSVQDFLFSKDKGSLKMNDVDSLHQLLQPVYMDLSSDASKVILAKLGEVKIANGWEPDSTQNYYIEHSRHDNYVPVQSARSILSYMNGKGFHNSLVPGKTNLQTNMLVFKLKHQPSGIVWAIQTMAAIQFWPVVYYEGEQNRFYHDVVKDLNLMKVIKYLESWGLDLRKLTSNAPAFEADMNAAFADGSIDPNGSILQMANSRRASIFEVFSKISGVLEKLDLTFADVLEMLSDSGITVQDITDVILYFQSSSAPSSQSIVMNPLEERVAAPIYLLHLYEQTLANWYKLGGYDVEYETWGWNSVGN